MMNVTDTKAAMREIEQEAYQYYEKLSGNTLARRADGSFKSQGHNDEIDAFRHAYTSGRVTQIAFGQQWIARKFGNDHEVGAAYPNDPYEHRMDLWNNEVGRRLGDENNDTDALADRVYEELRNGGLVKNLKDPRLRQLYPEDPRLARAQGDPQRELLSQDDVERINQDISRIQDQSLDEFPRNHSDRAYFDSLRNSLPESISDTKVAETLLAAKRAGIEQPDQVANVILKDDQIFIAGKTAGFRAQVDALAAAPDMRDSVYQVDQHDAVQAYDQGTQNQTQGSYSPQR